MTVSPTASSQPRAHPQQLRGLEHRRKYQRDSTWVSHTQPALVLLSGGAGAKAFTPPGWQLLPLGELVV